MPPTTIQQLLESFDRLGYEYVNLKGQGCTLETPEDIVISIQWSPRHYCFARQFNFITPETLLHGWNAEMCMWHKKDNRVHRPEGWEADVKGWIPVYEILRIVEYMMGDGYAGVHSSDGHGVRSDLGCN
jgi:hypothetical protein